MSQQIQEVKDATDIVQVIGEKISLQRSGKNFRALCPFHSEKSPSFFVVPEIQAFRCFGCGEKGDVFTFLQKYDGLTFGESLKLLADRVGIKLEERQFSTEDHLRERLLEILELTKKYYHFLLTDHRMGEVGRAYLKDRKTSQEIIKQFQLGYSLPSWDGLIKYLVGKKKFHILDLVQAGLVIQRSQVSGKSERPSDYYDRFRGRLMFPLTDHRGRVVGFSGRTLEKDAKTAKYINSPETLLYHKSQLLFGYSHNYRQIRDANSVIVVEGEFDVLTSVQAHVGNVVAIKGSAFTKEHADRLRRAVDTIILSLDADNAGVEATKRAIEIVRPFPVRLRILPSDHFDGKDPDDIAREHPKRWRELAKESVSAYQFLIDSAFHTHDATSPEGKQDIVSELAPTINRIDHAVEKAHYSKLLAERLGVTENVLQQDLNKSQFTQGKKQEKKEESEEHHMTAREKVERYVLHVFLHLPQQLQPQLLGQIDTAKIEHPGLKRIAEFFIKKPEKQLLPQFFSSLPEELRELASDLYLLQHREIPSDQAEFDQAVSRWQGVVLQQEIQQLTNELSEVEKQGHADTEQRQEEILAKIVKLRAKLVKY